MTTRREFLKKTGTAAALAAAGSAMIPGLTSAMTAPPIYPGGVGSFEELPTLSLGQGYDLVVCADVLQYVPDAALKRGVRHIATLLGGVAFLEAYTTGDEMEGDLEDWHPRSKSQYRRIFADAGLVACGVHCYLNRALSVNAVELELV